MRLGSKGPLFDPLVRPSVVEIVYRCADNYIGSFVGDSQRRQDAHNVVLTSIRRRFNVMDVVWTLKRRRVRTGKAGPSLITFN